MVHIVGELIIGPLLIGAATLVARRWGAQAGGVVSALPAVVGPVLLIAAQQRGPAFAGRAATGTLLGLVALGAFAVGYSRTAASGRWWLGLTAGWIAAALAAVLVGWLAHDAGAPAGVAIAALSLAAARRTLPRGRADPAASSPALGGVSTRMAVTAALIACLSALEIVAGPLIGGMLAALPIMASVLAVFTHRQDGFDALIGLLRGMLSGMIGFVAFCAVVAWLIVPAGIGPAFAAAALTSAALQLTLLRRQWRTGQAV